MTSDATCTLRATHVICLSSIALTMVCIIELINSQGLFFSSLVKIDTVLNIDMLSLVDGVD